MPPGYLKALKVGLESGRGALLILDEAQTGARQARHPLRLPAARRWVPDIMTLSKHFGGGLPISAMVTTDAIAERALAGGLTFGHSHSSDPIACTAGLASIDEILEEDLPARARAIDKRWKARMESLQQRFPMIGDLRGKGCLQGVELVRDRATKEPAPDEAKAVYRDCLAGGLLFSVRGQHGNVLRFVPPFCTSDDEIDRAAAILERAFARQG